MDLTLKSERRQRLRQPESLRLARRDPALVGVFAAAVSAAGAARPSLWFDEAATISAGTRSVAELWRLIHHIDAVHGLYYLLMHGWFAVFPHTEFWTRLPSSLAVGAAAAGVVVLGRQLSSRTVSVCAGIIFAIMPRITWAGIEARSYAWSTLAAVWLTVLLIAMLRRGRTHPVAWAGYGVALAVCAVLNIFVVLMVLVHGTAVALLARRRATIVHWAVTAGLTLMLLMPLMLFCRTQIAQVRWISPLGWHTVGEILRAQYFDHSMSFTIVAGVLLALPLVLRRFGVLDDDGRRLAILAIAWVALPTAGLLLYSALFEPIYYPRYLCYTAPAMALLLAVCIVTVAPTREAVTVALAVLALAATPNYLFVQRGPYAKEGMDFSQVADLITARAAPGDCLILDNTITWLPGPIRPLTAARPAAYAKLIDPGRGLRAVQRNGLWDAHVAIWAVADRVRQCTVLWTVSDRDRTLPDHQRGEALDPGPRLNRAPAYRVPHRLGFHIVERWQFSFAQVAKSTR